MCRKQEPKKENFKMGRGGKEGFSINVAERRSGGRTCPKPETALSLGVGTDENTDHNWDFFPFLSTSRFLSSPCLDLELGNPSVLPPTKMGPSVGTPANFLV